LFSWQIVRRHFVVSSVSKNMTDFTCSDDNQFIISPLGRVILV